MGKKTITYKDSGVDIDKGNEAVDLIKPLVKSSFRKEVLTDLGGFGGLFQLDKEKYEEPILVSGTDGVGTKLKLAFQLDKHDTIGIDAVAMCVNDILASGAEPLFFLDYLAVGKLEPEKIAEIVAGVVEGCKQSECALIGGETAEMPGFYQDGEYDIAGFSVGVVDKKKIINGQNIKDGDLILGLASSGIHSNGFSLVRKVLLEEAGLDLKANLEEYGRSLGEVLLEPTRIYVKEIKEILKNNILIKGLAHITGGGFYENIPRVLPEGLQAEIEKDSFPVPAIFNLIQKEGNIPEKEMFRTFNMGIGMALIVAEADGKRVKEVLEGLGEEVYQIGRVTSGEEKILFVEENSND